MIIEPLEVEYIKILLLVSLYKYEFIFRIQSNTNYLLVEEKHYKKTLFEA